MDPNQIVEIRTFIAELGKEKTVLLSTHIMQEVEAICDRVLIINNGRIVADDEAGKIQSRRKEKFQTVEVEFDKSIPLEKFRKISGISEVKKVKNRHYLIQAATGEDIRSAIFQWAVKNKFTVLELRRREKSLEEVFKELTS